MSVAGLVSPFASYGPGVRDATLQVYAVLLQSLASTRAQPQNLSSGITTQPPADLPSLPPTWNVNLTDAATTSKVRQNYHRQLYVRASLAGRSFLSKPCGEKKKHNIVQTTIQGNPKGKQPILGHLMLRSTPFCQQFGAFGHFFNWRTS